MTRRILRLVPLLLLAATAAPALLLVAPGLVGADRTEVVQSGSMSPSIATGDLVVLHAPGGRELAEGDVIAFRSRGDPNILVLHRIIAVDDTTHGRQYVTKGDANQEADPQPVRPEDVVGVYRFRVPLYGYFVSFAQTPPGILLCLVVPSVAVVLTEGAKLVRSTPKGRRPR